MRTLLTECRRWFAGGVLLAAIAAPLLCAPAQDLLEAGFRDPPREARIRCYWWWLNGNTTEAAITRDLEQMKAKGYGGALLVDAGGAEQRDNLAVPAGPMFGSPAWRVLYRHALQEADRLGLELSLNIQSGWNLGGPMVKPEQGSKLLTWSRVTVKGPADFHQQLAQPAAQNGFYRDIAVLAYPLNHGAAGAGRPIRQLAIKTASQEFGMSMSPTEPLLEDFPPQAGEEDAHVDEVRDLSAAMAPDGYLTWSVPSGEWEILRMGYTSSNARISTSSDTWQGLAIDYMDRTALETYWHEVVDPLLEDARPYLGRSLRYLVTDSWELGGTNWTARFRDEFRARRGYDLLPYLPVIAGRIVGDRTTSNRFLNDFRRTIGDLIVSQHYAVFAELAARSGLGIHPESGGPHGAPIDALETLGASTFPQTEFWARSNTHRTRDDERFFIKEASSAAHIYGKTIVAAEGMTSIGPQWEEIIWNNLKPSFDQAACSGLNRLFWHTFTSSPKEMGLPGQEYFAGTHLNPNVTWWNQAGAFISYIDRSQFLLQQGQPVSDVVYYYGDHVPNFVRLKSADPAGVLPGYDYDVTDEQVLAHRMVVRDGRIVASGGASYALLVLPDRPNISLEAMRAVRKLVADGAAVLGPRPRRTTGLQGDAEVAALAAEVWGDCGQGGVKQHRFGRGTVYCGQPTREVLAALGVRPDFEYRAAGPAGTLDYVHRQSAEADIYFVRSSQPEPVYAEVTLRSRGRAPELWDPATGNTRPQPVYTFTEDGRIRLPLWLEPYGSVFVVLRRAAGGHIVQVSRDGTTIFPMPATSNPPEMQFQMNADGSANLETHAPGRYAAKLADGEALSAEVPAAPAPVTVAGPWSVEFTPGWGAPAKVPFDKLQSWTDELRPRHSLLFRHREILRSVPCFRHRPAAGAGSGRGS